MEIATVRRILVALGAGSAVFAGGCVANGDYLLPGLLGAALGLGIAVRLLAVEVDALVAGAVLVGYLAGNRGFAQLHVPGLPLLPGEAALGLGFVLAGWRAAITKALPIRRGPADALLLAWMAIGAARLACDLPGFGLMAVRDFALVYYAGFYFLAAGWAGRPAARRWIEGCLSVGFALTTPAAAAFGLWPETLMRFSVAGAPLIFVKGDVAGSFMAAGVFWFAAQYARKGGWLPLIAMSVSAAGVVFSNSRAALVALGLGTVAAVVLGNARLRRALLLLAAAMIVVLTVDAVRPREPGTNSKAFRLYESVRSALDVSGTFMPVTQDLGDKPDNNRFRLVWWQAVFEQTRAEGPWLGLGFGRDLAGEFLRRYYADNSEEFYTRSPHNFLLTVFARMGLAGLLALLAFLAAAVRRMVTAGGEWQATGDREKAGAARIGWLAPAMILISACFGVVLEGPMAAAVFWTLLGLANAGPAGEEAPESDCADTRAPEMPIAASAASPPAVGSLGTAAPPAR